MDFGSSRRTCAALGPGIWRIQCAQRCRRCLWLKGHRAWRRRSHPLLQGSSTLGTQTQMRRQKSTVLYIRYAEDRRALSEKYSRSKVEAASLRDELARVTEDAASSKEQLDQAQSQLETTVPVQDNATIYRSTISKLTEAISVQTAAGEQRL